MLLTEKKDICKQKRIRLDFGEEIVNYAVIAMRLIVKEN